MRKSGWVVALCSVVFVGFVAFWSIHFLKHSTPQKALGSTTIFATVPFAKGVILLASNVEGGSVKASYLTKGFWGWNVEKESSALDETPSNSVDISQTNLFVGDHTFTWGTRKKVATEVNIRYGGKTYRSNGQGTGNLWYIKLPLSQQQFINSNEFLKGNT